MFGHEICSVIERAVSNSKLFKGVFTSTTDITLEEGEVAIVHSLISDVEEDAPGHWTAISRTGLATFEAWNKLHNRVH